MTLQLLKLHVLMRRSRSLLISNFQRNINFTGMSCLIEQLLLYLRCMIIYSTHTHQHRVHTHNTFLKLVCLHVHVYIYFFYNTSSLDKTKSYTFYTLKFSCYLFPITGLAINAFKLKTRFKCIKLFFVSCN